MEKHKINVSEPWDFQGPAGNNLIIGKIKKILSPTTIVFESDHPLQFENESGKVLLLKSRYENDTIVARKGYEGTVGGALLLISDYVGKEEKELVENSKYVLIGGLERVE